MIKTKKLKILTTVLLSLAVLICSIPMLLSVGVGASTVAAPISQSDVTVTIDNVSPTKNVTLRVDSTDGYYIISNADELDAFAVLVRTRSEVYAKLTANITYNSGDLSTLSGATSGYRSWMPAGAKAYYEGGVYKRESNPFTGIFDGQNFKISGIYYSQGATSELDSYGGLFAVIRGGTVRNVTVEKSYFAAVSHVGSIAGLAESGAVIENCHNVGSTVRGKSRIGGIVGDSGSITVRSCSNSGKVEVFYVNNGAKPTNNAAGGITSSISAGTIDGCFNSGKIISPDSPNVGGITGQSIDSSTVQNCLSTGYVDGRNTSNVGGLIGYTNNLRAYNNVCLGDVIGYQTVGHVWGGVGSLTEYSNNYHCHKVTVTRENAQIIWDEDIVTAVESDAVESGKLAYDLGGAWGQSIGNDSHPIPGAPKVYYGYTSCADDAEPMYTNDPAASTEKPSHDMEAATCLSPATCKNGCGHTEGEADPDGHLIEVWDFYSDEEHCGQCTLCSDYIYENHAGGNDSCMPECESCGNAYFNNDGKHNTMSEWTPYSNDSTLHIRQCLDCGRHTETEEHKGGEATCTEKAVCSECSTEYGEVLDHLDENTDHICDRACGDESVNMDQHADSEDDGDHVCDYGCGETLSAHADGDEDEKCDECDESLTTEPDTPGTDTPGTDTPDVPGTDTPDVPGTDTPGTDTPDVPGTDTPDVPGIDTHDDPENAGTSDPSVIFALVTLVSAGGFTLFAAKKSKKD